MADQNAILEELRRMSNMMQAMHNDMAELKQKNGQLEAELLGQRSAVRKSVTLSLCCGWVQPGSRQRTRH